MTSNLNFETLNLIFKLREIEDVLAIENDTERIRSAKLLFSNPAYTPLLPKRFPMCNSSEEIYSALALPKDHAVSRIKLYTSDRVVFHCRRNYDMKSENCSHVIYALTGSFSCATQKERFVLPEGHSCIFSDALAHSFFPNTPDGTAISLLMSSDYLKEILLDRLPGNTLLSSFFARSFYERRHDNDYLIIDTSRSVIAQNMLLLGLSEFINRYTSFDEVINSCVVLYFSELLKLHTMETDTLNYDSLNQNKGSELITFIQENCATVTLNSAANHFHFHPNYFSNLIKNYTGTSFKELVQDARLTKACILLKYQDIPITQISNEVGYQNINYFYELFKRRYGQTPAQYRKANSFH